MVAPFDHVFPIELEDVSTTDPPVQNVVGPLELIAGILGAVFKEMIVGEDDAEQVPLLTVTI